MDYSRIGNGVRVAPPLPTVRRGYPAILKESPFSVNLLTRMETNGTSTRASNFSRGQPTQTFWLIESVDMPLAGQALEQYVG